MTNYIKDKFTVLKELHILSKCNKTERQALRACTTEISADNYARMLINKYL